ncbi:MAG: cyclic pyranopterin monophosphate synthase MoaC [Planctomycetota bacterium]
MDEANFTHLDSSGAARMVDVGEKPVTRRTALARAICRMKPETALAIRDGKTKKGEVLQIARIAGIAAAKRTDELIPLCHSLPLETVSIDFSWPAEDRLAIEVLCVSTGKTGVEMEALTSASIAGLTVYDMCKAMDRSMSIECVELLEKTGGIRGDYKKS